MLQGMKQAILQGERDFERLQGQAVEALAARGWLPDYVAVRNQSDLQPARHQGDLAQREWVILAAARLGNTRLLDNIEVCLVDDLADDYLAD
jgi:pantoate--beta-alanine ligase